MWACAISAAAATLAAHPACSTQAQRTAAEQQAREQRRIAAMPRPKIECEGCGACAFELGRCTYCLRPTLNPAHLAQSSPLNQLGSLYGVATRRPELLLTVK